MKQRLFALMALLVLTEYSQAQKCLLFNEDWTFTQGAKTIKVDLPHDWDIYTAPNPQTGATGTGGGWYQGGKGEYRKTLKAGSLKLKEGQLAKLLFEGVYQKALVMVNGQKAGQHAYGYTPFTVDITAHLNKKKDGDNEILVKVDNSEQPNCRWYSGSGIYRHVWLTICDPLHIAENGIFVTTPEVSTNKARVQLAVSVANEGNSKRSFELECSNGSHTESTPIMPHTTQTVNLSFILNKPELWSPSHPYLYETTVTLKENGQAIARQTVKYGIRSISFDAERGFLLNGQPTLVNGACLHHDDGVLGAMAFDAAEIRKVRLMKEAGFNLIRTSHNPPTRAFLDACDSLGMMVIDEAFDGWRSAKTTYDYSTLIDSCYREDIHAMVLRDRNHPSIISWSIGNEVIERKDLRVVTTARQLKKAILECDTTRPVTEALCAWDRDWEIYDPHFEVLDIGGYNYMMFKHASDHERDPKRVMWQTESYPRDAFTNWKRTHDYPYIVGDIVWTGLDYLGESGIGRYYYKGEIEGEHYRDGGMPDWHGAYCGDVDLTGWRKPISHYRDMLWNQTKGIYMAVSEPNGYRGEIKETQWSVWPTWESWTWPGWEGKPIKVEIYTQSKWVNLYLDNQLVGTQQVGIDCQYKAVFTIPYKAGTLRAVNADGDTATLYTAGQPAAIRLTADRAAITADGQDLAFVTMEVVDKEGRVVPEAAIPCNVEVSGAGSLMAAASADLKDTEPYTSPKVTTWKGRALIVVRSTHKKGKLQVKVRSTLPAATLSLRSK
jgi:beta-galactosidase